MDKEHYIKYLLLGILILFFLILIAYEIYEGFDNQPRAVPALVRQNKTCPDPDMQYMIDRFEKATLQKPGVGCTVGIGYAYPQNVPLSQSIAYCLPTCPSGYIEYSNDTTYCVRSDDKCGLTKDLSNNIQDNWARVCAPLYQTNLNLLSTMGSISTVVSTINNQYATIRTNFPAFSNSVTLNASGLACNSYLRDTVFNVNIISNYYDLNSFNNSVNSYWIELSNKKNKFNEVFNSFNCGNYM